MNILPLHGFKNLVWDFTVGPYGSEVVYEKRTSLYCHATCAEGKSDSEFQEAHPGDHRYEEGYGTCRFCQQPIIKSKISKLQRPAPPTEMEHFI